MERCHTFAVAKSCGSRSWVSSSQRGCNARNTFSTTIACSWRSLGDEPSRSALPRSSTGSPARAADPARGFARISFPNRETRSSGLAPTSVLPSPRVDRERIPVGLDRSEALQQLTRIQGAAGFDADRSCEHDLAEHPALDPVDRLSNRTLVRIRKWFGEHLHLGERRARFAPSARRLRRGDVRLLPSPEHPRLPLPVAPYRPPREHEMSRSFRVERDRSEQQGSGSVRGERRNVEPPEQLLERRRPHPHLRSRQRHDPRIAGPHAAGNADPRALEEAAAGAVGGQQVERPTKALRAHDDAGRCHARVPTINCVMPPDSCRRSASGNPTSPSIASISAVGGR